MGSEMCIRDRYNLGEILRKSLDEILDLTEDEYYGWQIFFSVKAQVEAKLLKELRGDE